MSAGDRQPKKDLGLRLPVIVLVVAFTAIPLELRPLSRERLAAALNTSLDVVDIVANIAGYVPVGAVLASEGTWLALGAATVLSVVAEVSQLFSEGRDASAIDVATNVIGAAIGLVIGVRWKARWRIAPPQIGIDGRVAGLAAALALGFVAAGAVVSPRAVEQAIGAASSVAWFQVNDRGATAPGKLEAHWRFERSDDANAPDASGNGLDGVLINGPTFVAGVDALALRLNGVNQYVNFGQPVALRLTGSMTISAWINSSSFPVSDAAIVSDHNGLGYQLDTTVDQGQRTISFRIANAAGRLTSRYGKTPLELDTWYHVAGVYDARARTLDVYLNGQRDNGCLTGSVMSRQRISGGKVYVGRPGIGEGFEFAGSIDDVRIYSRALTQSEIQAETKRLMPDLSASGATAEQLSGGAFEPSVSTDVCQSSEPVDAKVIGLIVCFGLLVGVACVGFWRTPAYRLPCLIVTLASGFLLYPAEITGMTSGERWMIPLFTLLGGMTAAASVRTSIKPKSIEIAKD
jgi:VanZ family protein